MNGPGMVVILGMGVLLALLTFGHTAAKAPSWSGILSDYKYPNSYDVLTIDHFQVESKVGRHSR